MRNCNQTNKPVRSKLGERTLACKLVALGSILVFLVIGCGGGTHGTGGFEIEGNVADANNKQLSGVAIALLDSEERPIAQTTTSTDGRFFISNVNPQSVIVEARVADGASTRSGITFDSSEQPATMLLKQNAAGFFDTLFSRNVSEAGTKYLALAGNLYNPNSRVGGDELPFVASLNSGVINSNSGSSTYEDLYAVATFSIVVSVVDPTSRSHDISLMFFPIVNDQYIVRAYVNDEDVSADMPFVGRPRFIEPQVVMDFNDFGQRIDPPALTEPDTIWTVHWANRSTSSIEVNLTSFTMSRDPDTVNSIQIQE